MVDDGIGKTLFYEMCMRDTHGLSLDSENELASDFDWFFSNVLLFGLVTCTCEMC